MPTSKELYERDRRRTKKAHRRADTQRRRAEAVELARLRALIEKKRETDKED